MEAPAFALHERGLALLDSRERVPLVHLGEQPGERAASRTRGTAEGVARAEEGPVDRQAERGVQLCPLCPLRLQALPRTPGVQRTAYSARTAVAMPCRRGGLKRLVSIFEQVASFDDSGVSTPGSSLFVNGANTLVEPARGTDKTRQSVSSP